MEITTVNSVITGLSALLGVVVGTFSTAWRESRKAERDSRTDKEYLAALVSTHLHRFVAGCRAVAQDDGTDQNGDPNGPHDRFDPVADAPKFDPLKMEVNWKSVSPALLSQILEIPYQCDRIEESIFQDENEYPSFTSYFESRRRMYAKLGLMASALSIKLRAEAALPALFEDPEYTDHVAILKEVVAIHGQKLLERQKRDQVRAERKAAQQAQAAKHVS